MNEACCTRPVPENNVEPVGTYEKVLGDMKSYKTGPSDSKKGIIFVYDAPGYSDPLLHGADILASHLSATVFVPDFYRGNGVPLNCFPMDTPEKKATVGAWFSSTGDFGTGVSNLGAIAAELKAANPQVEKWAAWGFCWGGKILAITGGEGFVATGASHPGMMDKEEAKKMKVPHASLLAGEDGTKEELQAYGKALEESGQDVRVEYFWDDLHGWMAARCDFKDEKQKAAFEKGYQIAAEFLDKYL